MSTRHRTPSSTSPSGSPARLVLLVPPVLLVLAACGAGAPAASPTPGTTASAAASTMPSPAPTAVPTPPVSTAPPTTDPGEATSTGPRRCAPEALAGTLRAGDAGAGQRSASLILTNRSGRPCRLDGYGGIQLADTAGRGLPTRQVRDPGTRPRSVLLAPGAAGSSLLRWTAVPGESGTCGPTPASLRVIPPDMRSALSVPWSLGPVCGGGRIVQGAYRTA